MTLSLSNSSALKRRQRQQREQNLRSDNLQPNQPKLVMSQALAKIIIKQDAPSGSDTDHLLPVVEFLKARGYRPATNDAFFFNRDGLGTYGFAEPLDIELLNQHFTFPPSIKLSPGKLFDSRHFVTICQSAGPEPVRKLSFEA